MNYSLHFYERTILKDNRDRRYGLYLLSWSQLEIIRTDGAYWWLDLTNGHIRKLRRGAQDPSVIPPYVKAEAFAWGHWIVAARRYADFGKIEDPPRTRP